MNVGLYRTASAMVASQRQLEVLSTNLANLGTSGYKRGAMAAHEFQIVRGGRKLSGIQTSGSVDFSQGELARTGRDLDFALFGAGFFAVEAPQGEVYTRDGSFHVTSEGVLVTGEGYPLALQERSGSIDPTGLPLVVDGEGSLRQGERNIGRLRLAHFATPQRLTQDGHGFWVAPDGLREIAPTGVVHQYALEEANTSGVDELVAMVSVQRAYELTADALRSIDDSYQRLTRPN